MAFKNDPVNERSSDGSETCAHEASDHLIPLTVSVLWTELPKLFGVTLLGLAIALPMLAFSLAIGHLWMMALSSLMIYPLLIALMGLVTFRLSNSPGGQWNFAWNSVQANWRSAVLLGFLLNGSIFSYLVNTANIADRELLVGSFGNVLWFAQAGFTIALFIVLIYALPLISMHGMGVRLALRNSFVLAASFPMATLGVVSCLVVLGAGLIHIGPGTLLLIPEIVAVILVVNCYLRIEEIQHRAGSVRGSRIEST